MQTGTCLSYFIMGGVDKATAFLKLSRGGGVLSYCFDLFFAQNQLYWKYTCRKVQKGQRMFNQSPAFQILRGGLAESAATSKKEFISAYITDTRLMGVVGLVLHWYLPENLTKDHFFQFFYMDAEEYGFDTYRSVLTAGTGEDALEAVDELRSVENSLIGCLGGKKAPLTEREARAVVQQYVNFNLRMKLPLPEGIEEYQFLLGPHITLDSDEALALMKKQSPVFTSEFQVIHYFLMRCFGRDFSAAKFLTKNYVRTNLFPEHKAATLLQNAIDPAPDDSGSSTAYHATDDDTVFGTFDTHKRFLCESLIEYEGKYYLIVTQLTLEHLKIVKYERISSFRISPSEAAMITDRPEFITLFYYSPEYADTLAAYTAKLEHAMRTEHENGCLSMLFYPHNNHVNKQVFRLSDDVFGVVYVADSGELLLSSNTRQNLRQMEAHLLQSEIKEIVTPLSRYHFQEPVLYDFIHSDCDDFEEYVQAISEPEDEDHEESAEDLYDFPIDDFHLPINPYEPEE